MNVVIGEDVNGPIEPSAHAGRKRFFTEVG